MLGHATGTASRSNRSRYLRETPAEPLSPLTKAILWIGGTIVALLFLAAIWRAATHPTRIRRTRPQEVSQPRGGRRSIFQMPLS